MNKTIVITFLLLLGACGANNVAPEPREPLIPDDVRCCTGDVCKRPNVGQASCDPAEARQCDEWLLTRAAAPTLWECR